MRILFDKSAKRFARAKREIRDMRSMPTVVTAKPYDHPVGPAKPCDHPVA
jgi:hypothetical protein